MSTEIATRPEETLRQAIMSPSIAAQLKMALPAHITVERFQRVVITALQQTPDLQSCDRPSLMRACIKCAQDGLVPDGREAALVKFGNVAQYMPMVAGILKKVRNSGELTAISANVVYSNDKFALRLGDDEKLEHEPAHLATDRGAPIGVYAIATLKSGEKMREVLSLKEIEKVRAVSRAKNGGPWVAWWDEMARKTAIRRLSKRLPMSTDRDDILQRVIERDDELAEMEDITPAATPASAVTAALASIAPEQDADERAADRMIERVRAGEDPIEQEEKL